LRTIITFFVIPSNPHNLVLTRLLCVIHSPSHQRAALSNYKPLKKTATMSISNIEASENGLYKPRDSPDIHFTIAACCTFAVCLFGMLGNGIAFWFLCFRIPLNTYTVYIINLMIADFVYLFFSAILMIMQVDHLMAIRMFFLLAISIERCLSVYYPIWYRCRRPKHLSLIACLIMWLFACLVMTGLEQFVCTSGQQYLNPGSEYCTNVYFFTSALYIIVVLVLVVSSFTLLFDIQKASKHCHPPKLYIVIIVSATVFLISVIPARILGLLLYFKILNSDTLMLVFFYVTSLCSAFNCSTNPYIYMVVGRFGKRVDGGSNIKILRLKSQNSEIKSHIQCNINQKQIIK
uniref:G-protein coupled receptors family 1 profile domain-containing protein n=1 Tax=Leptobrachium leishanense TaxID=445787 RepID=A0A8C5PAR3_9ANUR